MALQKDRMGLLLHRYMKSMLKNCIILLTVALFRKHAKISQQDVADRIMRISKDFLRDLHSDEGRMVQCVILAK